MHDMHNSLLYDGDNSLRRDGKTQHLSVRADLVVTLFEMPLSIALSCL